MQLINIEDLTELATQLNEKNYQDDGFLKQFCTEYFLRTYKGQFFLTLDNISNQIFGRLLIVRNRLRTGKKDIEKEEDMFERAKSLGCGGMAGVFQKIMRNIEKKGQS